MGVPDPAHQGPTGPERLFPEHGSIGRPRMLEVTTIRRTLRIGWLYLAIGSVMSLFLSLILLLGKDHAAFATTFPLEIPLFAVLGSTGGLMTFSSDRTKGVYEYLLAYGVPPRTLFTNGLLATAAMSGIILALALGVGLGAAVARGVTITQSLVESLTLYTIPMGFAGGLFTTTVGMIWSTVSTPRTGMNSPVGIAPLVGVGPTLLVLFVAEDVPSGDYYYVTVGAALLIIVAVVALLALSAKLMGRERFLSPL